MCLYSKTRHRTTPSPVLVLGQNRTGVYHRYVTTKRGIGSPCRRSDCFSLVEIDPQIIHDRGWREIVISNAHGIVFPPFSLCSGYSSILAALPLNLLSAMESNHYDVLIVGAGIAGTALAHALSTITSNIKGERLRICLLERSLAEPDRIVGELLQPGGVMALNKLGMASCLENIDAVPVRGYCVVESGETVRIPYPGTHEGRSFHHGRFIQALRAKAKQAEGVEVIEASASDLIECAFTRRTIGVRATRKGSEERESFYADLVFIADGCFSNFRSAVLGPGVGKSSTKSHFVGAVLDDARLPIDKHGTVALVKGSGPVLLYQIAEHDTRILIDIKQPLPSDLKVRTIVFRSLFHSINILSRAIF